MNKSELIEQIAQKAGIPKTDATKALDALVETVIEVLKEDDTVAILGFGTFRSKHREERVGPNPKTGETMTYPAKNVPAFKPGKGLKDALNT